MLRLARLASSLGGHCDYDEACAFSVTHSSCQSNECRCLDGHEPDAHATKCTPTSLDDCVFLIRKKLIR
ncbi:hypothetical protein HPB50_021727 [Hyalomma asiaticum]|uniref:Uncharacterized protein n=1 Tax=Hyalomma asiaticum TaxID=266040 RepID=A0ACB7SAT5_HYAAI|nr:hypothetical protein HPB50_021727 [Hyalomma asiaticum]